MNVGTELCHRTTYKQIMTSDNITNLLNFDERASTASFARDPQDIMGGQIDALENKISAHGSIPVEDRMPSVASTTQETVAEQPAKQVLESLDGANESSGEESEYEPKGDP